MLVPSREFTDSDGVVWRVWDVSPTYLHPVTRSEDFMEPWAGGWLAFESAEEKRRLPAPYPRDWPDYELSALEMLCRAANPVTARRAGAAAEDLVDSEHAAQRDELARAERTFTSPRGRVWRVRLHECVGGDGRSETVLRFTAGDIVTDLRGWPPNWKELTLEEYALLLLDAEPPRVDADATYPRRRREDRPHSD